MTNCNNILKEFQDLLIQALRENNWKFFENPNLQKCWQVKACSNINCPAYDSDNLRCWHNAGTLCNGEVLGEFAKKIKDCHNCTVYIQATQKDIVYQIGEEFNNLMLNLSLKEDALKKNLVRYKNKNSELSKSNKLINSLLKELEYKNKILHEQSIKDELTSLYNYRQFRNLLIEQFEIARRYETSFSCIMLDIDFFKNINDTFGHQAGDSILRQMGLLLLESIRETDKVFRYGGEEFAILLPNTNLEQAYLKGERIRIKISNERFIVGKHRVSMTVSQGIASYSSEIQNFDQLTERADRALYTAKKKGRNQTIKFSKNFNPFPGIEEIISEKKKVPMKRMTSA